MKKIYLIPIIPFTLMFGSLISYQIIGSEIAPDGTLIEPFFLISLGWLSFIIGIFSILILFITFLLRKK